MGAAQQALSGYGVAALTYATWNPADKGASVALSNGNLTLTQSGSAQLTRSTISKTTGKWYWEVVWNSGVGAADGICNSSAAFTYCGSDANGIGYDNGGNTVSNAASVAPANAAYAIGDVIGFALDATAGTIGWYKNNVFQKTSTYSFSSPIFAGGSANGVITANFGATALTYTPPTGFNAGLYN